MSHVRKLNAAILTMERLVRKSNLVLFGLLQLELQTPKHCIGIVAAILNIHKILNLSIGSEVKK